MGIIKKQKTKNGTNGRMRERSNLYCKRKVSFFITNLS